MVMSNTLNKKNAAPYWTFVIKNKIANLTCKQLISFKCTVYLKSD